MSQERSARVCAAVLARASRSLLLALALVCAPALSVAVGRDAGAALAFTGGVIAFERGGEIYVVDTSGGAPTKIVEAVGDIFNMQPALSPDGSRVAFSSRREGKFSLYVVDVDGSGLRRVTDGPGDDSEPAWSPDGSRLAFVRGFDATGSGIVVLTCVAPGNILTVAVDGGLGAEASDVPAERNLTHGAGGTDPSWSPDGTRIAFASDREGSYDIYTMSAADGHDVRRLTSNDSAEADPVWSPDGSRIAYTGNLIENRTMQCGNMPIVGDGEGGGELMRNAGPYLYRMKADGSEPKSLTESSVFGVEPAWSPDGSQIVFAGRAKGDAVNHIYLTSWDGTGPLIQLTSDALQDSSPSCATAKDYQTN
ncbi:MAG: PD40 domain-containing protein [Acidobacteria bacterium]|nr:PD40 domain-containing protein [Acidobacteriota bacterium]